MQTINQAKERVCKSLLSKVNHFDKLLEETDLTTEKDKIEKLYSFQSKLLTRLERVVTN